MEFDSVIKKRHSIRSFKDKSVSWKLVMDAIDSAIKAPFAGNNNNLKFIIVESPELIEKLAKYSNQDWISEATIALIVCSNDKNLERLYQERGKAYSKQQAGATIENLLLKITDLGLSSCWVGAYDDEKIKSNFDIPEDIQIEAIIPVGYEKKSPKTKEIRKQKLDNLIYWDLWNKGSRKSLFEEPSVHPPNR